MRTSSIYDTRYIRRRHPELDTYNNYTSIFIRIQFSMKRIIYRRVISELFSALNFPSEWLDRRCRI